MILRQYAKIYEALFFQNLRASSRFAAAIWEMEDQLTHAGEGPRLHHRAVARDDAVGNHLMPPFSHQAQNALKLVQGKRFWLRKRTTQQAIHGLVQAGHAR